LYCACQFIVVSAGNCIKLNIAGSHFYMAAIIIVLWFIHDMVSPLFAIITKFSRSC